MVMRTKADTSHNSQGTSGQLHPTGGSDSHGFPKTGPLLQHIHRNGALRLLNAGCTSESPYAAVIDYKKAPLAAQLVDHDVVDLRTKARRWSISAPFCLVIHVVPRNVNRAWLSC
jgi:hypothetical protein